MTTSTTFSPVHGMQHSPSITGVDQFENAFSQPAQNKNPSSPFPGKGYTNVASAKEGARVLFATDEWFADADNLLKDSPPTFDQDAYCPEGKVMDGWESRRRREAGHDWCIIKLPKRAVVHGIEVDTAHFTGNHVPAISLELGDLECPDETKMVALLPGALDRLLHGSVQGHGCSPEEVQQAEDACRAAEWRELLPKTKLSPGYEPSRMHFFALQDDESSTTAGTHLRLNYFPDGGVARLKLWGHYAPDPMVRLPGPAYAPISTGTTCTVVSHLSVEDSSMMPSQQAFPHPELSVDRNGGRGVGCSNKHYGEPWHLTQTGLGRDMGDGWETARHPDRPSVLIKNAATNLIDNHLQDWCVLQLGAVATKGVSRILLDTKHFRGNYPESVMVEGCHVESGDWKAQDVEWFSLIPRGRMAPDSEHVFDASKGQIASAHRPVSHVRVSIFPDGGLSRVRVYGPADHF